MISVTPSTDHEGDSSFVGRFWVMPFGCCHHADNALLDFGPDRATTEAGLDKVGACSLVL